MFSFLYAPNFEPKNYTGATSGLREAMPFWPSKVRLIGSYRLPLCYPETMRGVRAALSRRRWMNDAIVRRSRASGSVMFQEIFGA